VRNEFRKDSGGSKGAYVGVIEQKEDKARLGAVMRSDG
jgi:hypothetical protein